MCLRGAQTHENNKEFYLYFVPLKKGFSKLNMPLFLLAMGKLYGDAHAGEIAHLNRFMPHSWDKKILA